MNQNANEAAQLQPAALQNDDAQYAALAVQTASWTGKSVSDISEAVLKCFPELLEAESLSASVPREIQGLVRGKRTGTSTYNSCAFKEHSVRVFAIDQAGQALIRRTTHHGYEGVDDDSFEIVSQPVALALVEQYRNESAEQADALSETGAPDAGDVAEWVGLHYRRNFGAESPEHQKEWTTRYVEAHADAADAPTVSADAAECHPYVVEVRIGEAVPYCPFDTNFPTQDEAEAAAVEYLNEEQEALEARIFCYTDHPDGTQVSEVKSIGRKEAESRKAPEAQKFAVVLLPSGAGEIGAFRVIDLARASGKSVEEFTQCARDSENFLVDVSNDVGPLMRVPGVTYQAALTTAREEFRRSQWAGFYEVTMGGAGRWKAREENTTRTPWSRDDIQFPRLLAEIMATQDLDLEALAASMDLTIEEVNSLFDRADQAWENFKAETAPVRQH